MLLTALQQLSARGRLLLADEVSRPLPDEHQSVLRAAVARYAHRPV
jgi:CubicO group peptidase (beta-lactamase class C family)